MTHKVYKLVMKMNNALSVILLTKISMSTHQEGAHYVALIFRN